MLSELPGKLLSVPLTCVSRGSGNEPPNLYNGLHGADWLQYSLPQTGAARVPPKFGSTTSHISCELPPNDAPPYKRPPSPSRPVADRSMPSQYRRLVFDVVSTRLVWPSFEGLRL